LNIGIVPHTGKPVAMTLTDEVAMYLQEKNVSYQIILEPSSENLSKFDVAIILGGDGTLLNAARLASVVHVPVFGVNVGHLGFLTEVETDGIFPAIDKLLAGNYKNGEKNAGFSNRTARSRRDLNAFSPKRFRDNTRHLCPHN